MKNLKTKRENEMKLKNKKLKERKKKEERKFGFDCCNQKLICFFVLFFCFFSSDLISLILVKFCSRMQPFHSTMDVNMVWLLQMEVENPLCSNILPRGSIKSARNETNWNYFRASTKLKLKKKQRSWIYWHSQTFWHPLCWTGSWS